MPGSDYGCCFCEVSVTGRIWKLARAACKTLLCRFQVLSESPATSSAPTPRDAAAPAPTAPARSSREVS